LGYTIEIVGPSGVGKTTLYEELLQVSNHSLKGQPSVDLPAKNLIYDNISHFKLLEKKILSISTKQFNSAQKIILMNYFSATLLRDLYIRFEDTNSKYLLDEGILHNFAKELSVLSGKDFLELVDKKSVIYIRPDKSETVVDRLLKRANEVGHMATHHQGLNYQQLVKITEESVFNLDNLIQLLEKCGVRLLSLRAESEKKENQKLALNFIL
jgi:hypothetical protein